MKFTFCSLLIVCIFLFAKATGSGYVEQCLDACKDKKMSSLETYYCYRPCIELPFAYGYKGKKTCEEGCIEKYDDLAYIFACQDACEKQFSNK